MRNAFYIAITLITIIFGCSKEPVLNIREGLTFDPDTIMLDTSLKGWELYSWKPDNEWKYSLMPGTDRIKGAYEITANTYSVKGREQLKLMLRRLPSGEKITWFGNEWTTNNVSDVTWSFEIPPLLTQYDINEFCELRRIELIVIP